MTRRRVIVNCHDGSAHRGLVWEDTEDLLILVDSLFYDAGAAQPRRIDGRAFIPKANVRFIQHPEGG